MNSGYIKLYRATLEHPMLAHDNNALIVFLKLLLKADRQTGVTTTGRYVLGELTNLKPITAWKALLRLRDNGMVTLTTRYQRGNSAVTQSGNSNFTTIHICNWEKWQGTGISADNSAVSARYHINKKKKENTTHVVEPTASLNSPAVKTTPLSPPAGSDAGKVVDYYNLAFGTQYAQLPARLDNVQTRLKRWSVEDIIRAIDNAHADDFFNGGGPRGWRGNLDYLVRNDVNLEKYLLLQATPKKEVIF